MSVHINQTSDNLKTVSLYNYARRSSEIKVRYVSMTCLETGRVKKLFYKNKEGDIGVIGSQATKSNCWSLDGTLSEERLGHFAGAGAKPGSRRAQPGLASRVLPEPSHILSFMPWIFYNTYFTANLSLPLSTLYWERRYIRKNLTCGASEK